MSYFKLNDRWSDCVNCKYNTCEKKTKLTKNDYLMFNCTADPETFNCPKIIEIYPEKIYNLEKDLDKNDRKKISTNKSKQEQVLEPFLIELYDNIESNIITTVVIGDDIKEINKYFNKILKKRNFRRFKVLNIRKLNSIFNGYDVVAVPKNYKKIVYPEVDIQMDHGLKEIRINEMVIDLEQYPNNKKIDANMKMNIDLSDYIVEKEKDIEDINKEKINGTKGKPKTTKNKRKNK